MEDDNAEQGRVSSAPITIFRAGRPAGEIQGGVFQKRLDFSRHALRNPPAVAWDISVLRDAERKGARAVRVIDRETGHVYTATLATVWRLGFPINRGFGDQWALALEHLVRAGDDSQLPLFVDHA